MLFSIAGGGTHPYYHDLLKEDKGFLYRKPDGAVLKYNVDRIDVDIEGSDIDENYEAL